MIKEITGHKSDCVRVYKRTSTEILEHASKCIGGENDDNGQGCEVKVVENRENVSADEVIAKEIGKKKVS